MPMLPSKIAPFPVTSSFSRGREKTIRKRNVLEEKRFRFQIKPRLRVVPLFSSGIVERAKRERSRKGDTRRGERKMREKEKNGVIFTRARVSLALLSLRKNGDYS